MYMITKRQKTISLLATIIILSVSQAEAANTAGPRGPRGLQGVRGKTGPAGAVGPQGAVGPVGAAGLVGPQGAVGPAGVTGAAGTNGVKGDIGLTGATGPAGPVGATGLVGPQGPVGLIGAAGTIGPVGATGAAGTNGAAGSQGEPGSQGLRGAAGADGASLPVHAIGEPYQGGIVFWVDADGQHGLIAAKADQSPGVQWYNGTYFQTNATADGIYAGAKNTEIIIATQTSVGLVCGESTVPSYCLTGPGTATGNYAALIAANYSVQDNGIDPCTGVVTETCYGDWYLPSKFELNLLYNQKIVVGGFASNGYWSSSEGYSYGAWGQGFSYGKPNGGNKNLPLPVRAVRAF